MTKLTTFLCACGVALGALPAGAGAGDPCWAPDRSQPPDRAVARVAPLAELNADVARVSDTLKKTTAFLRIPNVRLMVTSYIGYMNAGFGHEVRISAGLYPPNTWREGCTLMNGPEFFNKGHVHVRLNAPGDIFSDIAPKLRDDVLTAYPEPTGPVPVGEETYYQSIRGVVLTRNRAAPWVPVRHAELLDFREREARRTIDGLVEQLAGLDASVERYKADMAQQIAQALDATEKARLRKAMDENVATLQAGNAQGRQELTRLQREAETALRAIRDERSRRTPEQLSAPARAGQTPLVKLNPALGEAPQRVNLIVVRAVANAREMAAPLEQAVRDIDYAALRTLLQ